LLKGEIMVRIGTAAAVLALMATPLFAQESTEQLKKELEQLRAEVDGLKAVNQTKEIPGSGAADADAMAADDSPIMTMFKSTKLSGSVDVSYGYSLRAGAAGAARPLVFGNRFNDTQANNFAVNDVVVRLDRLASKDMIVGYNIALGLGQDPTALNTGGGGANLTTFGLLEAWVEILAPIGNGLDIRMGKMYGLAGYEAFESVRDMNFSRGLLYTWAMPHDTDGIRLNYSFGEMANATFGLNNGWNSGFDTNNGKNVEFQVEVKAMKDLKIDLTGMWGPENTSPIPATHAGPVNRFLFDLVVEYKMDKLTTALEFDWGFAASSGATVAVPNPAWGGAAAYLKYQLMDFFASALRIEYYSEGFDRGLAGAEPAGGTSSSFSGVNERTIEFTLTEEFKIGNALLLRVEYRHDDAIRPNGTAGAGVTGPTRGSDSIAVEMIMPF
jgi:hypothetical protein